jgi:hypothetical protein
MIFFPGVPTSSIFKSIKDGTLAQLGGVPRHPEFLRRVFSPLDPRGVPFRDVFSSVLAGQPGPARGRPPPDPLSPC